MERRTNRHPVSSLFRQKLLRRNDPSNNKCSFFNDFVTFFLSSREQNMMFRFSSGTQYTSVSIIHWLLNFNKNMPLWHNWIFVPFGRFICMNETICKLASISGSDTTCSDAPLSTTTSTASTKFSLFFFNDAVLCSPRWRIFYSWPPLFCRPRVLYFAFLEYPFLFGSFLSSRRHSLINCMVSSQ